MVVDKKTKELLMRPLDNIELALRAGIGLRNLGAEFLGDIVTKSRRELTALRGFGDACLRSVEDALQNISNQEGVYLSLHMHIPNWDSIREKGIESAYKEDLSNKIDQFIISLTNNHINLKSLIPQSQIIGYFEHLINDLIKAKTKLKGE